MNERDLVRFQHMLDAAQTSQQITEGKTKDSLDGNIVLELALQKIIETIGEAASKITPETRDQYPQISWRQMISMRNILIHDYMNIDPEQLWKTVIEDIPPLIVELEKIIPPEPPQAS